MIILCRHGQTQWTLSRQHTGLTDIPLTKEGQAQAQKLGLSLKKTPIVSSFTSSLLRAVQTSELAGFAAEIDADLVEWDYGAFEGLTSLEIKKDYPGWNLFTDGAPKGETPHQVSARADRVLQRLKMVEGAIALFSHAHFCRALAARFLGLPIAAGSLLHLDPASISKLGQEHGRPALLLWNETAHLAL